MYSSDVDRKVRLCAPGRDRCPSCGLVHECTVRTCAVAPYSRRCLYVSIRVEISSALNLKKRTSKTDAGRIPNKCRILLTRGAPGTPWEKSSGAPRSPLVPTIVHKYRLRQEDASSC